ncbi:oxidoreductase [Nocardia panacis]|uniref:Oxidoreductase n=1 Tax=Nocardia panacis TaxID=2340916 RepID=A0A3A4KH63_9NOCA|nr:molybdopterin-dependent oxidoreductase [Nocardia panacis]RJO80349.1 oxidoreductase [Nocardia panacis]
MVRWQWRTAAGIVSAGLTVGLAELLAVVFGPDSDPLDAIGRTVVDRTPDGVREWAITTFGTHDKTVLYVGMAVVAVVTAGLIGAVERAARPSGSILLAVLGLVTAVFAVNRGGLSAALPTIIGTVAGIFTLRLLIARIGDNKTEDEQLPAESGFDRRKVLQAIGITTVAALATGIGGRILGAARRDVSGERAAVQLPRLSGQPVPVSPEADLEIPGLAPYLTGNPDFYRIDTALLVPQVSVEDWSLRIHGMVDNEIHLSWADLIKRAPIERLVTLTCVSNPVGGNLVGNARWLGYRLDDLLAEARPHPDADMVLSTSVDGFTAGTPLAVLTDGRDAMLAIGMNDEPLPVQHGYPARLVVPGLYGYVSATKWVTELEVTRFDRATAYWTKRGWSARGPIKTEARIDTPPAKSHLAAGRVPIAGVAWAQHRGIRAVEVQIDDGPWQRARLAADQSIDTWRQWVLEWDATPGTHTLRVRATDGAGQTQTSERADVVPDGASGYPTRTVQVA